MDLNRLADALSNVKVEEVKQLVVELQKIYGVEVIIEDTIETEGSQDG